MLQETIKKQILMKENANYQSPQVEVIQVQVEQGFAASNTSGNTPYWNENNGSW